MKCATEQHISWCLPDCVMAIGKKYIGIWESDQPYFRNTDILFRLVLLNLSTMLFDSGCTFVVRILCMKRFLQSSAQSAKLKFVPYSELKLNYHETPKRNTHFSINDSYTVYTS